MHLGPGRPPPLLALGARGSLNIAALMAQKGCARALLHSAPKL